jgi:protein translocase SecG subunit
LSLALLAFAAPAKAVATAVPVAPPLQMPVAVAPHQTVFQQHFGWLTHGLAGLFVIVALLLIGLLAAQTTKQEGLSGSIGGAVQSAYGRPGTEEQLKRLTGFMAVTFVVLGTILSLTGI